jgi:hypothetical protein
MGHGIEDSVAFNFREVDVPPSPAGRTDGVFTLVLPSAPVNDDEVLIVFEHGDMHHDTDGRDFLIWQRGHNPAVGIAMETITIAHEGLELM